MKYKLLSIYHLCIIYRRQFQILNPLNKKFCKFFHIFIKDFFFPRNISPIFIIITLCFIEIITYVPDAFLYIVYIIFCLEFLSVRNWHIFIICRTSSLIGNNTTPTHSSLSWYSVLSRMISKINICLRYMHICRHILF